MEGCEVSFQAIYKCMHINRYLIAGYFGGGKFLQISTNRVQFVKILPLKCFFFSGYST